MDPWHYEISEQLDRTVVERLRQFPREPDLLVYGLRSAAAVLIRVWMRVYHRLTIVGRENLPREGSFIIVANHASHIDTPAILSALPLRKLHRVFPAAAKDFFFVSAPRTLVAAIAVNALPFDRHGNIRQSLGLCRAVLDNPGNVLLIYPEGTRSTTGEIGEFRPGIALLLAGRRSAGGAVLPRRGVPGLAEGGCAASPAQGATGHRTTSPLLGTAPRQGVRTDHLSRPPRGGPCPGERKAVKRAQRQDGESILPQRFLRMCRRNMRRPKVADSSGAELTGSGLLARTWILRRLLRRCGLSDDERHVAVLLPPSVAAVAANAALALDGRIAVNLNYTAGAEVMDACVGQCGIRHVLTSRRTMERLQIAVLADAICLEDLEETIVWPDKLIAAAATWLVPLAWLGLWLGLGRIGLDEVATVMFTSGTTGRPKGVMLTHRNIGANIDALDEILGLRPSDVLLAILPFFHSFGFTGTLWTILGMDLKAVYHYSPLEPRTIGKLAREHGATILVATATFLRSYLRRCEPEDFATLDVVFAGAEKLPDELAEAFEKRFGIRPYEGYGATELSPVAAGNVPPGRGPGAIRQGCRPGTVGRPLPGMTAKIVDLETMQDLGPGQAGMLLIKGPSVMKGYLDLPDQTAEVIRDGWYVTGDVAVIDSDGFIRITDRLSRFSKIAGEMVPHVRVEEAISSAIGGGSEEPRVAVTSIADPRKGEQLVVLYTDLGKSALEVCRQLRAAGLPALWVPAPENFCQVKELPILGTGKLDLKQIRQLAMSRWRRT